MDADADDNAVVRDEARRESEIRMIITAMARAACRENGAPEPTPELLRQLVDNTGTRRIAERMLVH